MAETQVNVLFYLQSLITNLRSTAWKSKKNIRSFAYCAPVALN